MKSGSIFFCSLITAFALAATGNAQNVPVGGLPSPSNTANVPLPANYNAYPNVNPTLFNYTRSWTPSIATDDTSNLDLTVTALLRVNTTYSNGWGQPIQSIARRAGTTGANDIITLNDLRLITDKPSYLPYAAPAVRKFQPAVFTDQKSFYNNHYPAEGDNAYSRTQSTSSSSTGPVVTSYAPGSNLTGSSRGTSVATIANTTGDNIKIWGISNELPVVSGSYSAGKLLGKKTAGQHGALSVEWTDSYGRLIYKTVDSNTGTNPYLLRTYYVYDDLGRIKFIITPKGVDLIEANGWSTSTTNYSGLWYYYSYNAYGQIVKKGVPGKSGYECVVYDKKQRPVLTQTPLLFAQKQWAFSIYDLNDRVRFSGYLNSGDDVTAWQNAINSLSSSSTITSSALEYYILYGFTGTYPSSLTNCDIQEYNYYDDYSFETGSPLIGRSFDNSFSAYFPTTVASPMITNHMPVQPFSFVQGLPTGKKVKVNTPSGYTNAPNQWTYSIIFYNSDGKPIQTQTLNPWNTSNWDVSTTQYDFPGNPVVTVTQHYAWSGATKASTKIIREATYNYGTGRLENVRMYTDNETGSHTLSYYEYDSMGRCSQKQLGGAEIQNYSYNIRGQLDGINIPYQSLNYPDQHFGESIAYDYGYSSPRYDGSISGFVWRGTGTYQQSYGYNYDAAGRMTGADYTELLTSVTGGPMPAGGWANASNANRDFTVSNVHYDANGNILSMKQRGNGMVGSTVQPVDMDDLTYDYPFNGNQLLSVEDAVIANYQLEDFVDNNNRSRNRSQPLYDYDYDEDGNLRIDNNKGITNITYNALDLPISVTTAANGSIDNVYDADGTLIEKRITFPTPTRNTTNPWVYRYCGPFVYRNDSLLYVLHEEGRARWMHDSLKFKYDFFVKDHLGNVHSVITSDVSAYGDNYLATHEVASAHMEHLIFDRIDEVREARPYSSTNNYSCARLNSAVDSTKIGTALLLHVMAGDHFNLQCQAYYDTTQDPQNLSAQAMSSDMLAALISTLGTGTGGFGMPGSESGPGGIGQGNTNILSTLFSSPNYNAYDQIKNDATDPNLPKAYLNYISFDEQMHIIPDKSGAIQMSNSAMGQWSLIGIPNNISVDQNGYLAVYLSNENQTDAYFDNVQVLHYRGRLLEEQHYYPFGLTMREGANNPIPNRYLWQGKELQDEVGLELYDFHARQYDPQLGRFWGIDPLDQFPSGYTGMGNDPANQIDPDGMYAYSQNSAGDRLPNDVVFNGDIFEYRWNNLDFGTYFYADGYDPFAEDDPIGKHGGGGGTGQGKANDGKGGDQKATKSNKNQRSNTDFGPSPDDPNPGRNPAHDEKLSDWEKDQVEKSGWDHDVKGRGGSRRDIWKDKKGNLYYKPKDGSGYGEPLGVTLDNLPKPGDNFDYFKSHSAPEPSPRPGPTPRYVPATNNSNSWRYPTGAIPLIRPVNLQNTINILAPAAATFIIHDIGSSIIFAF